MSKGLFITFEGGECSGKTSVIATLCEILKEKGIPFISTREPGGIKIGEEIRKIILDVHNTAMTPETEALLYAASRMQHLKEKILPALEEGKLVICDRFLDSSIAYQGFARNLGMEAILKINYFAQKHLPDHTIFIDVKPEEALKRLKNREKIDRLDLEEMSFHHKVYEGYLHAIQRNPDRYLIVDGERSLEEVTQECVFAVLNWWEGR